MQWQLNKRYNEFYKLNECLKLKNYSDLPDLPHKTIFPVRNQEKLDKRRDELCVFMRALAARTDILNSKELISFLKLDIYASEVLLR